jgi:hypothetical protein
MFSEYQWFSPDTKGPDGKDAASRQGHEPTGEHKQQQHGDNTRRGNQSALSNHPGGREPSHDAGRFNAVPGVSGNTQAGTTPPGRAAGKKDAPLDQG